MIIMVAKAAAGAKKNGVKKTGGKAGRGGAPVFVLAHSAGHAPKGAKHPMMRAWEKALSKGCSVENRLVYPKPFNLMGKLCAAHIAALEKAAEKGRPLVLVGFGMGARVAVHLLAQTPGDDGKPVPALPPKLRAAVKKVVAVNYPLLRVGSREVRDKPLLALPKTTPKTLFITAPKDAHMDGKRFDGVRKRMKAASEVFALPSGESEKPGGPAEMAAVVAKIKAFAGAA